MPAPRLEIDLDKICHNARSLVERLSPKGISVMGVTKSALGAPDIAEAMLRAGVSSLGDSRIENIESLRRSSVKSSMTLIRSPMLSQVDNVVAVADASMNTEAETIEALSASASKQDRTHEVVIMVELGDLREGVMPADLIDLVRETIRRPNLIFSGLGANLACQSGVSPDDANMALLCELADSVESELGVEVAVVSGGNSANLQWALTASDTGRINQLRLGESILLGRDPLHDVPVAGLFTDAVTLVAEVIESKDKPAQPWGEVRRAAFGDPIARRGVGEVRQALLAIGLQDVDWSGLTAPQGAQVLGASSDHLIVAADGPLYAIGEELRFKLDYSALVRAMTSPFVSKSFIREG